MPDYRSNEIPKQVWAHYHPFYGSPSGPTGRWLTWNDPLRLGMGYGHDEVDAPPHVMKALEHDPERFLGPDRRDNYSVFYPALGLYDCLDEKTLTQQGKWAAQANLDGLIWDYMLVGENNCDKDKPLAEATYDRSLRKMLAIVEKEKLPLSLGLMYDTFCWFDFPVERIVEDLVYIQETYTGHPLMLHYDGRLVVFIYSAIKNHTKEQWKEVCSELKRRGIRDRLFLVAGEIWVFDEEFDEPGLFDGFGAYNQGVNFLDRAGIQDLAYTLKRIAERNGSSFFTGTAQAGFDGRAWHHPGRVISRRSGALYEELWEAVIETNPPMVTVCSFNEWGEGTQIEPAVEYGELYLDLTAKWAAIYKGKE